jgi:hypothetical protein
MGIYSDKCEKCGHHVKKRAKFCSKCGNPAPGGWIKCYKCKKWIGTDSEYCPYCKASQHVEDRESIEDGVLKRSKGVFLQRFEVGKIKSRLDKDFKLIIEHGNIALLMEGGKFTETLTPGEYSLKEGMFSKSDAAKTNMSLFLIDSGEIIFPYSQMDLRSKDDMEVNIYTEVIFKLNTGDAHNLISNILKSDKYLYHIKDFSAAGESLNQEIQNSITKTPLNTTLSNRMLQLGYSDFWDYFKADLNNSVKSLTLRYDINNLIKNPDIRMEFENDLSEEVAITGQSYSMNIVRVAAVNFYGAEYEKLRKRAGEIEVKVRETVLENRARQMLLQDNKDKVANENELQSYMDQLAYEYDIDKEEKKTELELLRLELSHKLNFKSIKQGQDIQTDQNDFIRKEEVKDTEHQVEQGKKQHEFEREKRAKNHKDEIGETIDWIEIKALKESQKIESLDERMKVNSKYSISELASVLPPEQVDKIISARKAEAAIKLNEKLINLTPEQILAMKAGESEAAAKALAEISNAKTEAARKEAEVKAEMAEKAIEQMERVLNKSLDANAKSFGKTKNIIK